jgi:hypothetical protein
MSYFLQAHLIGLLIVVKTLSHQKKGHHSHHFISQVDAVGALIFQAQRKMAFVRKQEQTFGNAPTASLLGLSLRALFCRKICSQHCYSFKILAASDGLSTPDAEQLCR